MLAALGEAMLPEGHGLPGHELTDLARRIDERTATWEPQTRTRVRWLLRAWDLSPLLSRHLKRFTSLDHKERARWVARGYRSRWALRRNHVVALKQLLYFEWASTPEIEEALGYDYRCRKEEPTGSPEPADYHRSGNAIRSGAIPLRLLDRRSFADVPDAALETVGWPEIGDGHREHADVVVIGSGAGGAVVAATLAESDLDVVVLEEGCRVSAEEDFTGPPWHRFQRFCRDDGMTVALGSPPIPLPLGKVVGGTTVVNSGTCFRAPDRVLARWRSEFGLEGRGPDEIAPFYESIEDFLNVRPVPWELLGPNGEAAHRGAVALGLSGGPLLRNITDCHGCGQCAFGCPTGAKQAMHVSYLPRAQRAGARIYERCRVDRIVTEGSRATGVEASLLSLDGRRRGRLRVDADHVVVCAGAIHTPALLIRSEIRDRAGQTGHNLRIHPATGVAALFDHDLYNWKGTLQSYYVDTLFDTHDVMLEATTATPSLGAGSVSGIGADAMEALAAFRRVATLGLYVSDTSRGRVVPLVKGQIAITYRLNRLDGHRLSVGLGLAAEIMLAAGASSVQLGLPRLDEVSSSDDLEYLREGHVPRSHLKLTAFHPMGTVRMGADGDRSVVDPKGRHHQVAGLWVGDASTFPTCVAVNPQMTIMAFAEQTAGYLLEEA